MKLNLIIFIGGLLSLPATYEFTRDGKYVLSVLIIILIGAGSCFLSALKRNINSSRNVLSFVSGALISEITFFIYYYLSYGYQDQKLIVGIYISLIELFIIAAVGAIVVWLAVRAIKRTKVCQLT